MNEQPIREPTVSKSSVKTVLIIVAVFLTLLTGLVCLGRFLRPLIGDSEFDRKFEQVRPRMTRSEVIQILGPPQYESDRFRLGQKKGFEVEYERAARSNSRIFAFWERGDIVYAIGFDDSDEVVIAESGGT